MSDVLDWLHGQHVPFSFQQPSLGILTSGRVMTIRRQELLGGIPSTIWGPMRYGVL